MHHIITTTIGTIKIKTHNDKIISARFIKQIKNTSESDITKSLTDYLNGQPLKHKCKLTGTFFQIKVWKQIQKIPYGETRTYSDIAIAIGRPNSYRAVANACGQNKIALFIPCHRVIGKTNVGGYKWGPEIKQKLIELETQP